MGSLRILRLRSFAWTPSHGKSRLSFSIWTFAWEFEMLSLGISGVGSSNQENQSQETRFDDFLALAPEVDKTNPRKLDLKTFWRWLQKSRKPVPGSLI